jgi:hypothetical protein
VAVIANHVEQRCPKQKTGSSQDANNTITGQHTGEPAHHQPQGFHSTTRRRG